MSPAGQLKKITKVNLSLVLWSPFSRTFGFKCVVLEIRPLWCHKGHWWLWDCLANALFFVSFPTWIALVSDLVGKLKSNLFEAATLASLDKKTTVWKVWKWTHHLLLPPLSFRADLDSFETAWQHSFIWVPHPHVRYLPPLRNHLCDQVL